MKDSGSQPFKEVYDRANIILSAFAKESVIAGTPLEFEIPFTISTSIVKYKV